MGQKYTLIIGVEKYQDKSIPSVPFAEADAKGFSKALALHNFSINTKMLLNSHATKTTVESKLRQICSLLAPEDEFVFFYAGHGFTENDHNYITCFDSQFGDLIKTSISLQAMTCPPKRSPVLMLDWKLRKGGNHGQENLFARANHQQTTRS